MMKTFPAIALVLLLGAGCSPSPQSTSDNNRSADRLQAEQHPDKAAVSPEQVASDIVGRVVRVSDLSGNADPTEWTFESKEFRHVDILESKTEKIVLIRADEEVEYGVVMAVMDQLRQAAIEDVGLITEKRKVEGGSAGGQ